APGNAHGVDRVVAVHVKQERQALVVALLVERASFDFDLAALGDLKVLDATELDSYPAVLRLGAVQAQFESVAELDAVEFAIAVEVRGDNARLELADLPLPGVVGDEREVPRAC